MQIYNKKTKEIVAIIEDEKIILNKQYDVTDDNYVIGNGKKIYVDKAEEYLKAR